MACVRLSGMTGLVRKFRNSMGWVAQVRLRDVIALVQRYWRRSKKRPHLSSIWEGGRSSRCLKRSKLQNKSVEARPYQYWGPLDCHCHSQAPRPQCLVGWETCQPQSPEMTIGSLSVRKTSAWRRSTPSTRKAKAQESLSVKRRFRTSAWRRSTSSTKKPKAQLSQT